MKKLITSLAALVLSIGMVSVAGAAPPDDKGNAQGGNNPGHGHDERNNGHANGKGHQDGHTGNTNGVGHNEESDGNPAVE